METVTLNVTDGTKMRGYWSKPKKPNGAGIMVLQEAFGVNEHMQHMVRKFADEGYIAIAPELFHRTAEPGTTFPYGNFDVITPHFSAVTEKTLQDDAQACYDWLMQQGAKSVAAIGYCMGGRAAFVANATVPLSCAVSYYGGRIVPTLLHLSPKQKSPLLFFWGGLDKHITNEHVQTLNHTLVEAKKAFICVQISDADHAFSNDDRPTMYSARATRHAWAMAKDFLADYCGV